MKYLIFAFSILILTNCATSSPRGVNLSKYQDFTLKNGLKVIVVEDHALPYIGIGLLVKTGASEDPLGKSGLAELTATMLERGSKNMSATQIADNFGQLGTELSADVDYDSTYLATIGLSEHQDELIQLFFEVVTKPAFSTEEVDRLKSETIADIKRSYDQPSHLASQFFAQMLYATHPYGRSVSGSVRDVSGIKQKDLIRFYLKKFRPNNSMLVLIGDLNKTSVHSLENVLSEWTAGTPDTEKLPALRPFTGMQIELVNRPDLQQSEVRMGHYGVKRNIEDYQTLMLAETILGDGFTSRLMGEIRVKRGLTYGIGSSFDPRLEVGPFTISANTRHEKVGELVQETLNVYKNFYEKGVSETEVENAKGYLRGTFPRRIETPDQMARMLVALRFFGVSDDYMTNYVAHLNKISTADVNRVIKKYYSPENMKILIYAPKDKVIEQLRPIGAVEVKDYKELL
jgi:zinc protease